LNELNKLLHRGLVKKYRTKTGNINALKGQLLFAKHIQNNLVNKQHFYTKHHTYDTEHLINQILLKALNILSKICHNVWLVDRIKKLQLHFPEIKEITIAKSHFDQVKLNRKTKDYDEAIKIAKMIILNYSPDIKGGNENMIALLFNMNHLWEKYIYKMLKRDCPEEYEISEQKSMHFWETKTIRPDIIIKKGKATYIIDTKWKIIDNAEPSDADLKQMFAYNQYWDSNLSMLLFPQSNNNKDKSGKFHIGKNGEHFCM
jgi:5-methylcytosine-specific restriction enzyme subunit McrC